MNKIVNYRNIQIKLELLLNERKNTFFQDELSYILDELINILEKTDFICIDDTKEDVGVSTESIIDNIKEDERKILKFVEYYMDGKLGSCFHAFNNWWVKKKNSYSYNDEYNKIIFYRMRELKKGEKNFEYEDLLHIPFEKRGIIGNQRYSINGFPCLYISTSLYECWEELRRPPLHCLYAVAMAFTKKLKILDMRLIRNVSSIGQLKSYMLRLPLILACSIKVMEDIAIFKPEYIIPQTLLHSIRRGLDGILYTSLRRDHSFYDLDFDKCSNNDNIVLPVKTNKKEGHCEEMLKIIKVSEVLNFEHEIIKGNINNSKRAQTKHVMYKDTIMGQMEKQLKGGLFYIPINSQGFKDSFGKGLKSKYKHILV